MQYAKIIIDEFIMRNVSVDNEVLIHWGSLVVLMKTMYKDLCLVMWVCESLFTFDYLHDKVINFEAHLKYEAQKKANLSNRPTSANLTQKSFYNSPRSWMPNRSSYLPTTNKNHPSFFANTASSPTHQPNFFTSQHCPYISKCLLCDQQGHFAKCEKERRGMCVYVCMREKKNLSIPNTIRIHKIILKLTIP